MKYYLDCEFDGFGGRLLSLALVREDWESLYLMYPNYHQVKDEWVRKNVVPYMKYIPSPMPGMAYELESIKEGAQRLGAFLMSDENPITIFADWPDDISYFCKALMTGPGIMTSIGQSGWGMVVNRGIDAYNRDKYEILPGAVQHNAYWDAKQLKYVYDQLEASMK